jgi:magnesium transporter
MTRQLDEASRLAIRVAESAPFEAEDLLSQYPDALIVDVLQKINPSVAQDVLLEFDAERRQSIRDAAPPELASQWSLNQTFDEGTVGRLMEPPSAVFRPDTTVEQTIERLRVLVRRFPVTYVYVTDVDKRLLGVITMGSLLLADKSDSLSDVMLTDLFHLGPELELSDAIALVLTRHYPVYPVCDEAQRLIGLVRGRALFEEQAIEISAQPGSMVGVEKEERLATHWLRSLRFRHPWLQLNLLTAFLAAGVVGYFQMTIDKLVILAAFLPVLAGQSGNTGCQALAVTLRGITLGEMSRDKARLMVAKEALLGTLNGILVGIVAGSGMYFVASSQDNPHALALSLVVLGAMVGSCLISGISGSLIPLCLEQLGADPATASSIFLTTATDVVSMGLLLGLATWFIL